MFRKSSVLINLPSMPESIARIIQLTASDEATIERLAEVVLMDQTLTSRVLRLANSVMYARREKSDTVTQAIIRLGSSQVRNLAASASVLDTVFPKYSFPGFDWRQMWNHSVTCAVATQCSYAAIRGTIRQTNETAFIAGLLHDIGKMVIAYALPGKFLEIVAHCGQYDWDMIRSENYFLSTNHAIIGAQLATGWQLPVILQIGISYHHDPQSAPEELEIARAVCAGNMLAKTLANNYVAGQTWDVTLEEIGDVTKLSRREMRCLTNNIRDGLLRCGEILSWGDSLPHPYKKTA